MPSPQPQAAGRTSQIRRVLLLLLVANFVVVAAKLGVGLVAGSLAVLGDAVHSGVDALNNVLALVVMRVAAKAPDEDHPYGHGKFETLGALAIVGLLSITCFELTRQAINRLAGGQHPTLLSDLQFGILGGTLAVNVVVTWYEQRRGKQLGSQLLVADAAHTRADVFITVGVMIGMLLARRGWWWADPALAVVIALLIVRVTYQIASQAVPVLVDQRAIHAAAIQRAAEAVPGVNSAYRIRSRGGAPARYAEVTIAVDKNANVAAAHAIADEVEERLKRDLQLDEVTVHVEPC
jgi:cation diffusion facilitator family transporter